MPTTLVHVTENDLRRPDTMIVTLQPSVAVGGMEGHVTPAIGFYQESLEASVRISPQFTKTNFLQKIVGIFRGFTRRNVSQEVGYTREMPSENPYDRTFSGQMMVHL